MGKSQPRRYLAIIDGIVGGDGDGPLSPDPRAVGLIAASMDPVALDRVCAHIMGFEPDRLPLLSEPLRGGTYGITGLRRGIDPDVRVSPATADWRRWHLGFSAAPGWQGHIGRRSNPPGSEDERIA